MKGNLAKRLGVFVAAAALIQVVALPVAYAAVPGGNAQITTPRDLFAGSPTAPVTIRVNNTGTNPLVPLMAAPQPIKGVEVLLPTGAATLAEMGALPSGWTATSVPSANKVIFETTGAGITAAQNLSFPILVNVAPQAQDAARNWRVSISSDGFNSSTPAQAASSGALTTTTRIIKVLGVDIIGDARVTDNSVTSGQSGVPIRALIQNAGSGTQTVTPVITGLGTGSATGPDSVVVGPGETATAIFNTTFGAAGTVTPNVDANSASANGIPADGSLITVQTPFAATYGGSLAPTDVIPGESYSFGLTVNKTGEVGGTLDTATTRLAFGPASQFSAGAADATSFAAGNDSKGVTFASTAIPAIADAQYTPTLTLAGTDTNGAPFSVSPTVNNQIRVDSAFPLIAPTLTAPAPEVGTEPAATDGAQITFGGTVKDSTTNNACTTCTITGAVLRQYDSSGVVITPDIPVNVSYNSGTGALSGSYASTYDADATSVELLVTARKATLRQATAASSALDVDNIDPFFIAAATGDGTGALDKIQVTLNEAITDGGALEATDWSVPGNTVSDVTVAGQIITLDLQNNLGREDTPEVTYEPTAISSGHTDRVAQELAAAVIDAADGIVPLAPVFDTVSGLAIQGGSFYTNQSTPAFVVSGVSAGQTAAIYEDLNGNGTIEGSDRKLAEATAQNGNPLSLVSDDLGTTDRTLQILGQVVDGAGNEGPITIVPLVLDFTLPTAGTFAATADGVDVNFSEVLVRGVTRTVDWTVFSGLESFGVNAIAGSGATRSLAVDDPDWASAASKLIYQPVGASTPLEDRAGNPLAPFTLNQ